MYARISTHSGDMSTFLQHFESGAVALEGWNASTTSTSWSTRRPGGPSR